MVKDMVNDVKITTAKDGVISVNFSDGFVKELSKNIAQKVAEEVYFESIFLRFLPEIKIIESGKLQSTSRQ